MPFTLQLQMKTESDIRVWPDIDWCWYWCFRVEKTKCLIHFPTKRFWEGTLEFGVKVWSKQDIWNIGALKQQSVWYIFSNSVLIPSKFFHIREWHWRVSAPKRWLGSQQGSKLQQHLIRIRIKRTLLSDRPTSYHHKTHDKEYLNGIIFFSFLFFFWIHNMAMSQTSNSCCLNCVTVNIRHTIHFQASKVTTVFSPASTPGSASLLACSRRIIEPVRSSSLSQYTQPSQTPSTMEADSWCYLPTTICQLKKKTWREKETIRWK